MADPNPSASATKAKVFKPRAGVVRKNKAERDAYAKEEAEKAAARAAVAAQATGKPQTTKAATSKKRETARGIKDGDQVMGSSVFGAGSGTRSGWKRSTLEGGYSEMLEGQEGVKPSDGPSLQGQDGGTEGQSSFGGGGGGGGGGTSVGGKGKRLVLRDGENFQSDDEPDRARRDIERIWISSDEEEVSDEIVDGGRGKARARSRPMRSKQGGGLRPVRAPRLAPIEQEVGRERVGDKNTAKASRTVVDDGDILEASETESGDDMATDGAQPKQDMPPSPESSKRIKPGRKLSMRAKSGKTKAETVEERAERLRLDADIQKLREEFILESKLKGDEDMEQIDGQTRQDGKLFLFQFPPLVPMLIEQRTESGPPIKADPDDPAPDTSTSNDDALKNNPTLPKTQVEGMLTASEPVRLPPGRVGKLKVHKSGKVTLDWGGIDMEVRYGTEVNFLQDAVLIETSTRPGKNGEDEAGNKVGTTYALGQVQQKMVVIPDWQRLYD